MDEKERNKLLEKASTLAEALPFMREFAGETFVIKFGGNAMGDEELAQNFAKDIVLMKHVGINPVIVHGGGPQIGNMLERLGIKTEFVDGLRVTSSEAMEVAEMVLSGKINKQIVTDINAAGGSAIGLSGKDANLIEATRLRRTKRDPDSNIEKIVDLGFVGEPTYINPDVFIALEDTNIIPVIAPIGVGENGETYNINADTAAGHIASALAARKLVMLTDVAGVLDKDKNLISRLTVKQASSYIKNSTISGGMIPKVETCIMALNSSVEAAHILDGRISHVLLLEIFTSGGAGTMIA